MSLYEIIKDELKGLNTSVILNCREAAIFAYELYEDKVNIYEESDAELLVTLSENEVVVISKNHYAEGDEEWFVEPLWIKGKQMFNESDVFIIRDDVYNEVDLDKLLEGIIIVAEIYSEEDELCDMLCEDYEDDEYEYNDYEEDEYYNECNDCEFADCDCCDYSYIDFDCKEDNSYEDNDVICENCNCDEYDDCFFCEEGIYDDETGLEELIEQSILILEEAYALGYRDAVKTM